MSEKATYQINDEVWARVVQVVQEAMLVGQDCTDLFRQIKVELADDGTLVLTNDYKLLVKKQHADLLEMAEKIQSSRSVIQKDN